MSSGPHRKRIRHFHEPGDIHELTFSCYRRRSLLTNNPWRARLSRAIDEACAELACHLAALVYMPEHVHLLVWGLRAKDWRWSSARYYESDGQEQDELLPKITPLPAEFWSGGWGW